MHRRAILSSILSLTLLVAGAAEPAVAADPQRGVTVVPAAPGSVPISGDYWALIIGIDQYQHAPKLESAVKDAAGVRDVLVSRYGFKREHVVELFNEQATSAKIQNALYKLGRQAGKDDSVLIYYAGHGQYDEDGRLGWWVPVEAEPREPGTFITNASIRDYISGMKARHVYLVADSCFSGTLFGTRALPPINDQWYARLYQKSSRWGLTSGGKEPVADRGKDGHSVFAYHFITLLKENSDPYLVPSQIHNRLAPLVANNADQTPQSEPLKGAGDEGGQFVFRLVVRQDSPQALASGGPLPMPATGGASSDEVARMRAELDALKSQMTKPAEPPKPMEVAKAPAYDAPRELPREITGKDGASMVLIPAGEFTMGSNDADADEKPSHRVSLDGFYLDKYEMTNKLFQRFVQATGYQTTAEKEGSAWVYVQGHIDRKWEQVRGANWRMPEGGQTVFASNRDEHPVVSVSWDDAVVYCQWSGKRLPTEAEFEYALRGGTRSKYWWGSGLPGIPVANIADKANDQKFRGHPWPTSEGYDDGYSQTAPVGSFEPNPFGLFDMTGNVEEWTADFYENNYYEKSPRKNPPGPSSGKYRVFRGGSWASDLESIRFSYRHYDPPTFRRFTLGFRCAMAAPK